MKLQMDLKPYCRHFTGCVRNDRCNIGVSYDKVALQGVRLSIPCTDESIDTCKMRHMLTETELSEIARDTEEAVEKTLSVRMAVECYIEDTGELCGNMTCPLCSHPLRYSKAANGHLWISCSNDDCVRVME